LRESGGRKVACICCCELGAAPQDLTRGQVDEIYTIQDAGGVVTLDGHRPVPSIEASIDYALGVQEVEHIVVCGHSRCRFIHNTLQAAGAPDVALADEFRTILQPVAQRYATSTGNSLGSVLVQEHVLLQLEALAQVDGVARRLGEGRLKLYGWIVDEETARVYSFNVETGQFESLAFDDASNGHG